MYVLTEAVDARDTTDQPKRTAPTPTTTRKVNDVPLLLVMLVLYVCISTPDKKVVN